MTAAAVTPASFSFRTLVLLSAFAPMLLLPEVSVAFLSGPLEPLYYGPQVVPQRIGFSCSDPTLSVTPPSQQSVTYCGASTTPFGYFNSAPDQGTSSPVYYGPQVVSQRIGFSCSDPTLSVTPPSQQSVTYCGASTTPFGYVNAAQMTA